MIETGPVLLDIADGIARLRLNRPDAANGMSVELLRALCDAIMVCHGQPDVRAVLLTGEGKNFCAGGDVLAFALVADVFLNVIIDMLLLFFPILTSLFKTVLILLTFYSLK